VNNLWRKRAPLQGVADIIGVERENDAVSVIGMLE
jgi:hypothetical protein